MIDIKTPEEEKPVNLFYQQLENGITDLQKFKNLMIEVGIAFEQQGFELWINSHYSDGKDGFIFKFYDDESFKEFDYIGLKPENTQIKELHELNKTLKEILKEMRRGKV